MSDQSAAVGGGFFGLMNVFVDPARTVQLIPERWFWLWPVAIVSLLRMAIGYLMLPYTGQLVSARMAQQNVPADRLESGTRLAYLFSQIALALTPVFVVAGIALFAWLILVFCSMLGMRANFHDIFSLAAACTLITTLQYVAGYVVIRAKRDDIRSTEQLQPAFGLDIFTSDLHGPSLAILNFFSIFELWYIVVLGLGLALLTGSSKGKAFVAITPAWALPLLFAVVGSLFSR